MNCRCFGDAIYYYAPDGTFLDVHLVKDYLHGQEDAPNYDMIKNILESTAKTGEMFWW